MVQREFLWPNAPPSLSCQRWEKHFFWKDWFQRWRYPLSVSWVFLLQLYYYIENGGWESITISCPPPDPPLLESATAAEKLETRGGGGGGGGGYLAVRLDAYPTRNGCYSHLFSTPWDYCRKVSCSSPGTWKYPWVSWYTWCGSSWPVFVVGIQYTSLSLSLCRSGEKWPGISCLYKRFVVS